MLLETPDPIAVLGAIGAFLPLVTSLLKRPGWSTTSKRVFALAVAAVASVIFTGSQVGFDVLFAWPPVLDQIAANAFIVYVAAQTAYEHLWKSTAIETRLAGEDPTTVQGRHVASSTTPPM